MPILSRRACLSTGLAAGLVPVLAAPRPARAQAPLRFVLDWTLQGYHAPWALAAERGIFAREGVSVRMDRGYGSGDTITKVGSGAYDIGFADINGLVKFNAENPDRRVMAVYMVFDQVPASVLTVRRTGIAKPLDLQGRMLGAPETDAGRILFPAFASAAGIDASTIRWTSMAPNLREAMLATGQVDAITGLTLTTLFNLRGAGVAPAEIVTLPYADAGLDLYGSALIVSAAWAERNGDALRGFLRATLAGTRAAFAEPDAGIAALRRIEPLMDPALERERLAMAREIAIVTPAVRQGGLGTMTAERMRRVVEVNARVWGIASPPEPGRLFSTDYLPPLAERGV